MITGMRLMFFICSTQCPSLHQIFQRGQRPNSIHLSLISAIQKRWRRALATANKRFNLTNST